MAASFILYLQLLWVAGASCSLNSCSFPETWNLPIMYHKVRITYHKEIFYILLNQANLKTAWRPTSLNQRPRNYIFGYRRLFRKQIQGVRHVAPNRLKVPIVKYSENLKVGWLSETIDLCPTIQQTEPLRQVITSLKWGRKARNSAEIIWHTRPKDLKETKICNLLPSHNNIWAHDWVCRSSYWVCSYGFPRGVPPLPPAEAWTLRHWRSNWLFPCSEALGGVVKGTAIG